MDFSLLKGNIVNKDSFINQLSNILINEDETKCLKVLSSIYKFDKNYSTQLSGETRLFLENMLIEKYKFIFDTTQDINNLILSSRFIIQKISLFSEDNIKSLCDKLVSVLKDVSGTCSENQKFDIAQTLQNIRLQKYYQEIGLNFIKSQKDNIKDLYKGSQNVHNPKISEITKKALIIIEKDKILLPEEGFKPNSLEEFRTLLNSDEEKFQSIISSLDRIETDTTVFYPTNMMLIDIFERVYTRIKSSIHKDAILRRLKEELIEMNETCSSGHVSRLINVLSGFKDIEPKVKGNFSKEITMSIRRIIELLIKKEDEDIMDVLLESVYKDKREYNKFIDKNKSNIKDLVYKEFLDVLIMEELDIVFEICFEIVKKI